MQNWITQPKPNPQARLRLFCFSYAGGGASVYQPWCQHLPAQVELRGIQLPGRENRFREAPATQLKPLIEHITAALLPHLDKPFVFFGYSLGALLAFETVRALRRGGHPQPAHLFSAARVGPKIPPKEDPPVYTLSEADFSAKLHELNGTPQEILQNAELMQIVGPLIRADFQLNETYVYTPEPPLACGITAVRGTKDHLTPHEEMLQWQEETSGGFVVRTLPGDHFFMNSARELLLQVIRHDLMRVLQTLP